MSIEKQIKLMAAVALMSGMVAGTPTDYPRRKREETDKHKVLREDRRDRRKRERESRKKNRK